MHASIRNFARIHLGGLPHWRITRFSVNNSQRPRAISSANRRTHWNSGGHGRAQHNRRRCAISSILRGLAVVGAVGFAQSADAEEKAQSPVIDVVVVGGGVVGLAVARELVVKAAVLADTEGKENDFRLALLEASPYLCTAASGGNSGIGCTGYDAPADSLERAMLRRAISRHQELYRSMGLSYDHIRMCGALVVAWTQEELQRLPHILKENHDAGDTDARLLSREELLEMEPTLSKKALGAVLAPREKVVEPWLVPIAYAASAVRHGADLRTDCSLQAASLDKDTGVWQLSTSQGEVRCRAVINCAGLHGDEVERMRKPSAEALPFEIRPRKGQFVVFEPLSDEQSPFMVVQPVPTTRTKGVIVWTSVYGNVIVGPTADDQVSRTDRSTDPETIAQLRVHGENVIPALKNARVLGTYSGIRPATQFRDYVIEAHPDQQWITVGGIRSTGLTAASAIAEHVSALYQRCIVEKHSTPAPGEALVEWRNVAPPFPAARLQPSPVHRNETAPSLSSLAADYCSRGDGTVHVFGRSYKVTHPLSQFGMQSLCEQDSTE